VQRSSAIVYANHVEQMLVESRPICSLHGVSILSNRLSLPSRYITNVILFIALNRGSCRTWCRL